MSSKASSGITPEGTVVSQGTTDWVRKDIPSFKGMKAFVLPGAFYGAIVQLMAEAGFSRGRTVEESDVIVFAGGDDINPKLYGETALPTTYFDPDRDIVEETYYHKCVRLGKVMFGICRGAQFLHAMNGGKLWQHVDGHGGKDHYIVDIETDERVLSTSIHHQMLRMNDTMTLIAVTEEQVSRFFRDDTSTTTLGTNSHELEIEAGCYPDTKCFFVQGHPEVGDSEYRSWCMTKLHDFVMDWEAVKPPTSTHKEIVEEVLTQLG